MKSGSLCWKTLSCVIWWNNWGAGLITSEVMRRGKSQKWGKIQNTSLVKWVKPLGDTEVSVYKGPFICAPSPSPDRLPLLNSHSGVSGKTHSVSGKLTHSSHTSTSLSSLRLWHAECRWILALRNKIPHSKQMMMKYINKKVMKQKTQSIALLSPTMSWYSWGRINTSQLSWKPHSKCLYTSYSVWLT